METKWSRYYGDDVFVPDINEDQTIYEAFRDACGKYSDSIALEFGKKKITYRELLDEVDLYASFLALEGIKEGDRVLVSCRRMPHQVIALYALNKIGAEVIFVMRNLRPEVFVKIGMAVKAEYLIFSVDVFNKFSNLFAHAPIKKIILTRSTDYASAKNTFNRNFIFLRIHENYEVDQLFNERISFWSDAASKEKTDVKVCSDPDRTAVMFYSGTASGRVNTAMISSASMNAQAKISAFLFGRKQRRILSFVRLDYPFGTCFSLHTVLMSGHTYLINTQPGFEFSAVDLNSYNPEVIIGYPQHITSLTDSDKVTSKTYSSIKILCSCGNTMSGYDYHRIREFFARRKCSPKILRLYGITETSSVCMYLPENEIRPSALGIPVPGVMAKIINPDNNSDQINGSTGVIAVNTPSPMTGYLDREDDTLTVKRTLSDRSSWILSGDFGTENEDGMFFYGGSRRRVFDRDGIHVYPQLIEDIIRAVMGVADCCAVPIDRDGKTIIKVAVKPEADYLFNNDKLNEIKDEIERTCEMEIFAPARPDEYEFMAYLPMDRFGRVDYEQIIKTFKEEDDEQKSENGNIASVDTFDGV